jgi:hypothetical protein
MSAIQNKLFCNTVVIAVVMGDRLGKQHTCNMYELMPCIMQAIPDSFLQLSTLLTAEANYPRGPMIFLRILTVQGPTSPRRESQSRLRGC